MAFADAYFVILASTGLALSIVEVEAHSVAVGRFYWSACSGLLLVFFSVFSDFGEFDLHLVAEEAVETGAAGTSKCYVVVAAVAVVSMCLVFAR